MNQGKKKLPFINSQFIVQLLCLFDLKCIKITRENFEFCQLEQFAMFSVVKSNASSLASFVVFVFQEVKMPSCF